MKIIEYEEKYLEDVNDLLVELEEYIFVDVFAYNQKGINFYNKQGYHPRMHIGIKKI